MKNLLTSFALFIVLCVAAVGQAADGTLSSRVTLVQTGTIPNSEVKAAMQYYAQYGCEKIDTFTVEPGYSNVYCLNIIIAENE
jgi:hypothetical protein